MRQTKCDKENWSEDLSHVSYAQENSTIKITQDLTWFTWKCPIPTLSGSFVCSNHAPDCFLGIVLGLLLALFLPETVVRQPVTWAILGGNAGAVLYFGLALHMMFRSPHERIRSGARRQDEGRIVVLVMVILTALISLGAVVAQLSMAREIAGTGKYLHIALAAQTITTLRAFTQVMFALHYAHDNYLAEDWGLPVSLDFRGKQA